MVWDLSWMISPLQELQDPLLGPCASSPLPEVPAMFEPPIQGSFPRQEQLGRDSFPFILQHLSCLAQRGSAPSDLGNLLSFIFNSSFSSALFQSQEDTEAQIDPRL